MNPVVWFDKLRRIPHVQPAFLMALPLALIIIDDGFHRMTMNMIIGFPFHTDFYMDVPLGDHILKSLPTLLGVSVLNISFWFAVIYGALRLYVISESWKSKYARPLLFGWLASCWSFYLALSLHQAYWFASIQLCYFINTPNGIKKILSLDALLYPYCLALTVVLPVLVLAFVARNLPTRDRIIFQSPSLVYLVWTVFCFAMGGIFMICTPHLYGANFYANKIIVSIGF